MIQRKQSLFLLAAVISGVLVQFMPIQVLTAGTESQALCLLPGCLAGKVKSTIYLPIVLNLLAVLVSFICIFLFKNRKLQMKLCNILMILNIMICGSLFAFNYFSAEGIIGYQMISFLPLINSALAYFAGVYIKKDEELVRSADRIR